jgi:hypothetical protein
LINTLISDQSLLKIIICHLLLISNFAILASVRPADHLGGFLFAVLNAFDTVVELGVQLQPAGQFIVGFDRLHSQAFDQLSGKTQDHYIISPPIL